MDSTKNSNKNQGVLEPGEYVQQGDVGLHAVEELPSDAQEVKDFKGVVQEGERTGHAHRYRDDCTMYVTPQKERFLRIVKRSGLGHEEHKKIPTPPGIYRIGIVQEVDPFSDERRAVAD